MLNQAYDVYVRTFRNADEALRARDDVRLRSLCCEIAMLNGFYSTVSLMAVSDAERGSPLRSRAKIRRLFWCKDTEHQSSAAA